MSAPRRPEGPPPPQSILKSPQPGPIRSQSSGRKSYGAVAPYPGEAQNAAAVGVGLGTGGWSDQRENLARRKVDSMHEDTSFAATRSPPPRRIAPAPPTPEPPLPTPQRPMRYENERAAEEDEGVVTGGGVRSIGGRIAESAGDLLGSVRGLMASGARAMAASGGRDSASSRRSRSRRGVKNDETDDDDSDVDDDDDGQDTDTSRETDGDEGGRDPNKKLDKRTVRRVIEMLHDDAERAQRRKEKEWKSSAKLLSASLGARSPPISQFSLASNDRSPKGFDSHPGAQRIHPDRLGGFRDGSGVGDGGVSGSGRGGRASNINQHGEEGPVGGIDASLFPRGNIGLTSPLPPSSGSFSSQIPPRHTGGFLSPLATPVAQNRSRLPPAGPQGGNSFGGSALEFSPIKPQTPLSSLSRPQSVSLPRPTSASFSRTPTPSRLSPGRLGGLDLDTSDRWDPREAWAKACSECAAGTATLPELLARAAGSGHPDCVRAVIGLGPPGAPLTGAVVARAAVLTDVRDASGRRALHTAAGRAHVVCVELLLLVGANAGATDAHGRTPLHLAAASGASEAASLLVDTHYEALSVKDDTGATPLHLSAASGDAVTTRLLLESAADVRARDDRGATPLHAARGANVSMLLIESGGDSTAADARGWLPIHAFAASPDVGALRAILSLPPNTGGAAERERPPARGSRTPLHVAADYGHLDAVRALVEANAELRATDAAGRTPHAAALQRGHYKVAAFLELAETAAQVPHDANILQVEEVVVKAVASDADANANKRPPITSRFVAPSLDLPPEDELEGDGIESLLSATSGPPEIESLLSATSGPPEIKSLLSATSGPPEIESHHPLQRSPIDELESKEIEEDTAIIRVRTCANAWAVGSEPAFEPAKAIAVPPLHGSDRGDDVVVVDEVPSLPGGIVSEKAGEKEGAIVAESAQPLYRTPNPAPVDANIEAALAPAKPSTSISSLVSSFLAAKEVEVVSETNGALAEAERVKESPVVTVIAAPSPEDELEAALLADLVLMSPASSTPVISAAPPNPSPAPAARVPSRPTSAAASPLPTSAAASPLPTSAAASRPTSAARSIGTHFVGPHLGATPGSASVSRSQSLLRPRPPSASMECSSTPLGGERHLTTPLRRLPIFDGLEFVPPPPSGSPSVALLATAPRVSGRSMLSHAGANLTHNTTATTSNLSHSTTTTRSPTPLSGSVIGAGALTGSPSVELLHRPGGWGTHMHRDIGDANVVGESDVLDSIVVTQHSQSRAQSRGGTLPGDGDALDSIVVGNSNAINTQRPQSRAQSRGGTRPALVLPAETADGLGSSRSDGPASRSINERPASYHGPRRGQHAAAANGPTLAPTPNPNRPIATPLELSLSGGLILAAPRIADTADDDEIFHVLDVIACPPSNAGWGQRVPRMHRRKLVQDYPTLVDDFRRTLPYAAAARGGPALPCLLCSKAPATRTFLPCAHACVCDGCMRALAVGPMRTLRAAGAGPAATGVIADGSLTMRKEGSAYLQWDSCPLCLSAVLAVVPNGAVNDPAVRARIETIAVSVSGPAAAAANGQIDVGPNPNLAGDAHGPLGDGFGGAEGPVTGRFRTLFKRAGKQLLEYTAKGGNATGPPTRSDISRAEYDEERELWLDAATWTWDEGMGEE